MTACLIVTVDTEEEGLWGGRFPRSGHTVKNILGVRRFQELCDRWAIQPTYLVDAAIVQDDYAVGVLRAIQDDGRCEIGCHVHPWCNPPFEEELSDHNSYLCNLPEALQRKKLVWITDAIERRFGHRPASFRAGRYGLDVAGARILQELGYLVDSSVIPFTDYSSAGGPDFGGAPYQPYFVGERDLCTPAQSGRLLEVPVSVGFSRPQFARAWTAHRILSDRWVRPLRIAGILDRLNVVRRIKFSPEQTGPKRLKQLADAYLAQEASALVMMLHSSSLAAGLSPYVPTVAALDDFFGTLDTIFEYCLSLQSWATATLSSFGETIVAGNNGTPAAEQGGVADAHIAEASVFKCRSRPK